MLEEIMLHLRNFFDVQRIFGDFTVVNGKIENVNVLEGQHIRIIGSRLNDGVHAENAALQDEEFNGAVWILQIPPHFLALASEIEAWQTKNAEVSPYQSESFGGYSYTRATGRNGQAASWHDAFSSRLNAYRKARI